MLCKDSLSIPSSTAGHNWNSPNGIILWSSSMYLVPFLNLDPRDWVFWTKDSSDHGTILAWSNNFGTFNRIGPANHIHFRIWIPSGNNTIIEYCMSFCNGCRILHWNTVVAMVYVKPCIAAIKISGIDPQSVLICGLCISRILPHGHFVCKIRTITNWIHCIPHILQFGSLWSTRYEPQWWWRVEFNHQCMIYLGALTFIYYVNHLLKCM